MKFGKVFIKRSVEDVYDYLLLIDNWKKMLEYCDIQEGLKTKFVRHGSDIAKEGDTFKFHIYSLHESRSKIDLVLAIDKLKRPNVIEARYWLTNKLGSKTEKDITDYAGDFRTFYCKYNIKAVKHGSVVSQEVNFKLKSRFLKLIFWFFLAGSYFKNKKYMKKMANFIESDA